MIAKPDWDKLTQQQQWDQYCLLVSECGDSDEVEDPDEETQRLSADKLLAVPPIPHDELSSTIIYGDVDPLAQFLPRIAFKSDVIAAAYYQQFQQYGNTRLQE